uniref:Uncharacterized protein n=1 Tax=viral metagenome TaxID=1070528 RepID=A0A6C0JX93_9ZZZZ
MPSSYIEFSNPPSMTYYRTVPVPPAFTMKSLFTDNSRVVYKAGSLAPGGVGTVTNSRRKSKYT